MPVVLSPDLENSLGEVHPMWVFFHAKQQLPRVGVRVIWICICEDHYLTSGTRAIDKGSFQGLQALEMVTMDMTEKTCKRRGSIGYGPKIIN